MKFHPEERYQSTALMLEALDGAAQALESGVDVEQEENGLLTYDRAVCKADKEVCLEIAKKMRFQND